MESGEETLLRAELIRSHDHDPTNECRPGPGVTPDTDWHTTHGALLITLQNT